MEGSMQSFVGGRNHRMQELISGSGGVSCRPADWLLKMNLPPLMGRRDAAFDIAEQLACHGGFAGYSSASRFEVYCRISRLLKGTCSDSRQILLMLSSPDTRSREQRMLAHCAMLDSLCAALANFFELHAMTRSETFRDAMNVMDDAEAQRWIDSMGAIENGLLGRLRDHFNRTHWRVARYRTYAGKSFSAENADRYQRAYAGCVRNNTRLLRQFGITRIQEIQL